jgi:hypothetical protein
MIPENVQMSDEKAKTGQTRKMRGNDATMWWSEPQNFSHWCPYLLVLISTTVLHIHCFLFLVNSKTRLTIVAYPFLEMELERSSEHNRFLMESDV